MRRARYKEGDWFLVPLPKREQWVVGRIARGRGGLLIAYFFAPATTREVALSQLRSLEPSDGLTIMLIGDLGLIKGEWPILGNWVEWESEREMWRIPVFGHIDALDPFQGYRRQLHQDLTGFDEEPCSRHEALELHQDGLYGHIAVQIMLNRLLPASDEVVTAESLRLEIAEKVFQRWIARVRELNGNPH